MFNKHLIRGAGVWLVSCILICLYFYFASFDSQQAYQALVKLSEQGEMIKAQRQLKVTQQQRLNVSKQYFFQQDNKRLQWRLLSQSSELIFSPKQGGKNGGLVENFNNAYCLMQEKLIYSEKAKPQQILRKLVAQQGTYFYQEGKFAAEDVKLSRYLLPTHEWQVDLPVQFLLLEGTAQKVQLVASPAPHLKAQGFQATLHEWVD
jgi:hypothetical protein